MPFLETEYIFVLSDLQIGRQQIERLIANLFEFIRSNIERISKQYTGRPICYKLANRIRTPDQRIGRIRKSDTTYIYYILIVLS